MFAIKTQHVDDFIAARRQGAGQEEGRPPSRRRPSTRTCATCGRSSPWRRSGATCRPCPTFRMEAEPKKLATLRHRRPLRRDLPARATRRACPADLPFPAADWWRALLVTGYMTGWRISDLLALQARRPRPGRRHGHHALGGQQGQARRAGEAAPRRRRAPEEAGRLRPARLPVEPRPGGPCTTSSPGSRRRPAIHLPCRGEARAHAGTATSTASTTCAGPSPR